MISIAPVPLPSIRRRSMAVWLVGVLLALGVSAAPVMVILDTAMASACVDAGADGSAFASSSLP
jgi:hypothetical protein